MLESMWRSKGVKQESEMLGRVGLSSLPVKPQEEMVLVTALLSCPQPCREADHVSPGAEGLSSTWVSVAGAKTPLTQFKELKPQVWGRRQAGEAAAVPTPLQAGKERCLFLHHWTSLPPFGGHGCGQLGAGCCIKMLVSTVGLQVLVFLLTVRTLIVKIFRIVWG